jgi:hypothetical protein
MQLQDYDAALVARGFDGYQPTERTQMINHGYRYVARKNNSMWMQATKTFTVNPGDPPIPMAGASQLGADDITQIDVITDPYRKKLLVMQQEVFERKWLPLDLTSPQNAAASPDWYYVLNSNIYLLAPPQNAIQVMVYFQNYLPDMVAATDVPATPQILDEVILDAALVRAHRRAHEIDLAQEAQARIDDAIMDIFADDVWTMAEQQERVLPDNQWL